MRYPPHEDPPDHDFSDEAERMYRRVGDGDFNADDSLKWEAVQLPGFSLDRSKYRPNVADVLPELATSMPHIAHTVAGAMALVPQGLAGVRRIEFDVRLPGDLPTQPTVYCAELVHCPVQGNFAHTEIRIRLTGAQYKEKNWKVGPERKLLLKKKVASLFHRLT